MRAREFVTEKSNQQVDEILPALAAAAAPIAGAVGRAALSGAGMLGRGALSAAQAIGRGAVQAGQQVARGVGNIATAAARGAADAMAGGQQDPEAAQGKPLQLPKPGGMFNHPTLGQVKVLSSTPAGISLDTRQKLGFTITVNPEELATR